MHFRALWGGKCYFSNRLINYFNIKKSWFGRGCSQSTLGCSELSGCGGGKARGEILLPSATWQHEQNHHFKVKPSEISTENSVYLQQCSCGPSELSTGVSPHVQPSGWWLPRVVDKQDCFYPGSQHCWKVWGDDWSDFRIFRADGMSCWGTLSTPERWGTSLTPSCQRSAVPTPTFKQKQQYL